MKLDTGNSFSRTHIESGIRCLSFQGEIIHFKNELILASTFLRNYGIETDANHLSSKVNF